MSMSRSSGSLNHSSSALQVGWGRSIGLPLQAVLSIFSKPSGRIPAHVSVTGDITVFLWLVMALSSSLLPGLESPRCWPFTVRAMCIHFPRPIEPDPFHERLGSPVMGHALPFVAARDRVLVIMSPRAPV